MVAMSFNMSADCVVGRMEPPVLLASTPKSSGSNMRQSFASAETYHDPIALGRA